MSGGYLRRYTQLPALIYLLTERKLTLLDPQSWDDRNDSFYLDLYREKKRLKTVLALCFTTDDETYHHWSVFAGGSAGVRIEFKRRELTTHLDSQENCRCGLVRYLKLTQRRTKEPDRDELPFLKRYAFRHETEFRVIHESAKVSMNALDIPIDLTFIVRITLSPWLPPVLAEHLKRTLHSIKGCENLKIVRSTLISNQEWKNIGRRAT